MMLFISSGAWVLSATRSSIKASVVFGSNFSILVRAMPVLSRAVLNSFVWSALES